MQTQAQIYRSIRSHDLSVPALGAWRKAAFTLEINQWADKVDFAWDDGIGPRHARWSESGYSLEALIEVDESGWEFNGIDDIGHFTNTWEPGAIEHDRFNNRVLDWFVPADTDCARALYERACSYGDDWVYVVLSVTASLAGVTVGEDMLCGIESDDGENYFTERVFDMSREAIETARYNAALYAASR